MKPPSFVVWIGKASMARAQTPVETSETQLWARMQSLSATVSAGYDVWHPDDPYVQLRSLGLKPVQQLASSFAACSQ